jgi:hypothetical protein
MFYAYYSPFNDFMYSLFNRMYLSFTKLNFRCAFMFSNPLLRDRLFCVVPKGTLSVFRLNQICLSLKLKRYLNIRLFLRPVVDPINNWDFFA